MMNIWQPTYIVTDVETTGSNTAKDRITEIACVTVKNGEIISQYSTLINPHQNIPPYVAKMTGISQFMVSSAPDEYDVLDMVKSVFEVDTPIFVAHNVSFDYGFMSNYYKRAFEQFDFQQLCTLKLAKKLLPRDIKKNVGDLSGYFGIRMKNRHRALIDAKSTAMILIELLKIAQKEHNIQTLNDLISFQNKAVYHYKVTQDVKNRLSSQISDIPYSPGIFKFYDSDDELIYWDYAFNLNKKISIFFDSYYITSKLVFELTPKISKIEIQISESELSALIERENMIQETNNGSAIQNIINFDSQSSLDNSNEYTPDFIYFQAMENGEPLVDIYLINNGKLKHQCTVGKKAPIDSLYRKIHEIFFSNDDSNEYDIFEIKVINRWIDMQNDTGIKLDILELKSPDVNINAKIKEYILKSFEIIDEINPTFNNFNFY
jgi:DNA polymerase III epsilon subunit family exonuclease